jgi:hypothetical protein
MNTSRYIEKRIEALEAKLSNDDELLQEIVDNFPDYASQCIGLSETDEYRRDQYIFTIKAAASSLGISVNTEGSLDYLESLSEAIIAYRIAIIEDDEAIEGYRKRLNELIGSF